MTRRIVLALALVPSPGLVACSPAPLPVADSVADPSNPKAPAGVTPPVASSASPSPAAPAGSGGGHEHHHHHHHGAEPGK